MDVGARYNYKNNTFHVKVDAESNVCSFIPILQVLKKEKKREGKMHPRPENNLIEIKLLSRF